MGKGRPVERLVQLQLLTRLQDLRAIPQPEGQEQVDSLPQSHRIQLPAAKRALQQRDNTQLLRDAGARPRTALRVVAAAHLQPAIPLES